MADRNSVAEVIRFSLMLVGAISQDEVPEAGEAQDALNSLMDMLELWSTSSLNIFTIQRSVYPLGTAQVYTAGPGGDFNMVTRPARIDQAYCQISTNTPTSEVPIQIMTLAEWAAIPVKGTTSTIPRALWNDDQVPLSNISLFPIPEGVNNLVLYIWQQLSTVSALTDIMVFPPGYAMAIKYNLAVYLAPLYGKMLGADVIGIARSTKAAIQSKNLTDYFLKCDEAVQNKAQVFSWLTGEPC